MTAPESPQEPTNLSFCSAIVRGCHPRGHKRATGVPAIAYLVPGGKKKEKNKSSTQKLFWSFIGNPAQPLLLGCHWPSRLPGSGKRSLSAAHLVTSRGGEVGFGQATCSFLLNFLPEFSSALFGIVSNTELSRARNCWKQVNRFLKQSALHRLCGCHRFSSFLEPRSSPGEGDRGTASPGELQVNNRAHEPQALSEVTDKEGSVMRSHQVAQAQWGETYACVFGWFWKQPPAKYLCEWFIQEKPQPQPAASSGLGIHSISGEVAGTQAFRLPALVSQELRAPGTPQAQRLCSRSPGEGAGLRPGGSTCSSQVGEGLMGGPGMNPAHTPLRGGGVGRGGPKPKEGA